VNARVPRWRDGRVRGLGVEGDGAVLLENGSIVLARGVLPGERVRLDEIGTGKIRRARHVEVLEPSPERVVPPCAYASVCGGCPLMHASERIANETKSERVLRALRSPAPSLTSIPLSTPHTRLAYRRRARLAFVRGEAGLAIGYRADASRQVVDVERCIVLDPVLDALVAQLRARVGPHLVGSGELRLGARGDRGTLRIETRDPQPASLYTTLEALVREGVVAGAALLAGGASAAATFGERHEETRDGEGRTLRAPLGGFGQAHAEHNAALAQKALAAAEPDGARVLELYAGHGNFSLMLASRAASLVAVELDPDGAACLAHNLETYALKAQVITAEAAQASAKIPRGTIDVVLLDPPREGARDLMAPLVALAPRRIAYVSCSPESLARDASILVAAGYRLESVEAVDMFPQTSHVEVVARFACADRVASPRRQR
jgi:23S rRNA (uracil1939-C5)-methyltransferase